MGIIVARRDVVPARAWARPADGILVPLSPLEKLRSAFQRGLALPRSFDAAHAESSTLSQWDSVGHLQLVVAIEDAFGVQLTPAELIELTSFPKAMEILRSKGAWRDA